MLNIGNAIARPASSLWPDINMTLFAARTPLRTHGGRDYSNSERPTVNGKNRCDNTSTIPSKPAARSVPGAEFGARKTAMGPEMVPNASLG